MEDRLITVKDERGTLLKPLNATFKVEYKYEGEASAEKVLEGDVSRGGVIGTFFPDSNPEKVLEYSEVKVTPKETPWEAYSGKVRRFNSEIPKKDSAKEGVDMKLPYTGPINPNKEQVREALSKKAAWKRSQQQEIAAAKLKQN